ncbi:MAG: hypothetical protein PHQ40_07705 [Anaerolineaceae bacterium]|nr:hypothetical protein [Anaerolineaceae bacterium]
MTVTVLPTYKGYTVDVRLQEFRRAIYGQTLEFIAFNSPKGRKLLDEISRMAPELLNVVFEIGS